jgi:predicted small secreted protein
MRTRTAATAITLLAAAALTACNPSSTTTGKDVSVTGTPTTHSAAAPKPVPNLVGQGLQAAQDAAQAAGFYALKSHDSLGEDRHQILDRDWKVCTQTPAAGTNSPTTAKIDLGAVKLTETCPKGGEVKPPAKTGKTMPNFVGKGLSAARDSLPSDASITSKDASGQGRIIILESDWKICGQTPKAGVAYSGQPVTFTAVKTDETCP